LFPYAPWLCWLIPVIGAVSTLIFARINPKLRDYAPVAFAAASVVFSLSMIPDVFTGSLVDWVSGKTLGDIPYNWSTPWVGSLGIDLGVLVDPLSVLMTSVVCSIGLLVLVFSLEYMRGDSGLTRYWFLTQLFIGGLSMVVMAGNLMYFYSGTFNFSDINLVELSKSGLLLMTALMFFAGAVSKSAQFPLHVWLPDAMPATPASFNAITEVLAGVYLVARALPMFHGALIGGCGELTLFFLVVAWIGAFTALLGASMAMVQRNLVRVLAYSIMSQYAYMVVGLGVGGLMTDPTAGYLAGILHLLVDAFISGLLFLSAAAVLHRVRSQDMFDMGGLRARMPITFKCMAVGALATIGIPPLSGFWSEESVYGVILKLAQEASEQGRFRLMLSAYGLYFIMMVTAAVTTFYILRMMGIVFGRKRKHVERLEREGEPIKEVSPLMWVPMVIAASATVVIGMFAPFFITKFHEFFSTILGQGVIYESFVDVLKEAFLSLSFGITCAALLIGGYPAYQLYISRRVDPINLIREHPLLKKVRTFLVNRYYINMFYNKIFAYSTIRFSRALYNRLALRGFDALYYSIAGFFRRVSEVAYEKLELGGIDAINYLIANVTTSFCQLFRKTHSGILSYNMLAFSVGIVLLIVLIFIFGGFIP